MVVAAVMLRETGMTEPLDILLSTLLSLPDDRRAAVERVLVPVARSAALGELAADVAHDVANPLFGAIGLVDLLLEAATPESPEAAHLQLLQQTTLEMKATLQVLVDFARLAGESASQASLDEAVRSALRLLRHGTRRSLVVEERYPSTPVIVPCPPGALVQAVLQLLLAARGTRGLVVEVSGPTLRISPASAESVGTLVAERIITDNGGRLDRDESSVTLSWA
jgi:signal transduction histidine kinase